jgi:hypothetical protein
MTSMTGRSTCLRQTVRETPGYVAGFHLRDPDTNKALSVAIFEDMNAIERVREALGRRADDQWVGTDPDVVEFLEAHPF